MATNYSANQYECAFKSQKLQNWTIPKQFKERPSPAEGYTTFIATDRGHLLPGVKAKRGSAWPSFQGTWDLPRHIHPAYVNPTARSQEGQDRLQAWANTKSTINQAPKHPGQATTRTSQNLENINVDQPVEESKMPVNNPDQDEAELLTEQSRPKSQQNQAQSRPTSQSGQHVQSEQLNKDQSRPASQHLQTRSRPATHQSQVPADVAPVCE